MYLYIHTYTHTLYKQTNKCPDLRTLADRARRTSGQDAGGQSNNICIYIYIYIHIHIHMLHINLIICVCIYIYIYMYRERDTYKYREIDGYRKGKADNEPDSSSQLDPGRWPTATLSACFRWRSVVHCVPRCFSFRTAVAVTVLVNVCSGAGRALVAAVPPQGGETASTIHPAPLQMRSSAPG